MEGSCGEMTSPLSPLFWAPSGVGRRAPTKGAGTACLGPLGLGCSPFPQGSQMPTAILLLL